MITTPDHCRITPDSIEHALDLHQKSGNIARWHNWHEDKPGRRRPLYTVVLAGPGGHVIDLASLHEAHALCAGLASAEAAARTRPYDKAKAGQACTNCGGGDHAGHQSWCGTAPGKRYGPTLTGS